jgi:hypothetical protein
MSQAEELLNNMSEEVPVHIHPVPDTDTYFVIDPITRQIENTNSKKTVIMQYDHNSERFTFELPRYIDGHDMLECTSVTVNVDNIEVVESDGVEVVEEVEPRVNSDAPDMTDLRVHPNDPEKVISSWLISRNSTQLAGILSFHIEFKCADSNGNVVYEWSTDSYDEIEVRARKKNGEAAVVPYSDILEQWRTRIFGAGDSVMANIAAEGEAQVAAVKTESETQQEAVELKGAQTLESIPEDYTEVDAMAEEAVRSKADAISCSAEGDAIVVADASDDHIRGLKVFGKTTQFTTTGKNLLKNTAWTQGGAGITFTVNDDTTITVNGTATDIAYIPIGITLEANTEYILSGCPSGGSNESYSAYMIDKTTFSKMYHDYGETVRFNTGNETNWEARIRVAPGTTMSNKVFKPMVRLAKVTDPSYEPYTGGIPAPNPEYPQELVSITNPTINIYGKNLIEFNHEHNRLASAVGTLIEVLENGIIAEGVAGSNPGAQSYSNGWYQICYKKPIRLAVGQVVTASLDYTVLDNPYSTTADVAFMVCPKDGTTNMVGAVKRPADGVTTRLSRTITALEDGEYHITIGLNSCKVRIENIQLEFGEVPTCYEPHKPVQTITVQHSIPGIPVTSGGNHTDENGQQWICDEVDLERGVYVKRLHEETYDGSEDERWKKSGESYFYLIKESMPYKSKANGVAMSSRFKCTKGSLAEPGLLMIGNAYGPMIRVQSDVTDVESLRVWIEEHPFTVLYELETPIETPLTAEEIIAFKAIRTNYPNTTILNDAGAWMSVKYNADTKTYVENPKTLKLVDSSTGLVYELKIVDGNLTVVQV